MVLPSNYPVVVQDKIGWLLETMCTDVEPRADMFRVGSMTQPKRASAPGTTILANRVSLHPI